jgi:hypothetical protein
MSLYKSPEQIQDEIEETRARIDLRLSNLTDNAKPDAIASKLLNADHAGLSNADLINTAIDRVKANPIAALTIGAGLLGLAKSSQNQTEKEQPKSFDSDELTDDIAERVLKRSKSISEDVDALTGDIKHKVSSARTKVTQATSDTAEQVKAMSGTLGDAGGEAIQDGKDQLRYRSKNVAHWVKDNPLASSFLALAVGAASASIFTATARGKKNEEPIRRERAIVAKDVKKPVSPAKRKRKTTTRKVNGSTHVSANAKTA